MRNFDGMFMEMAHAVSKMSRAVRAKVGALIVRDGNVLSIGFNGTPARFDNNCEEVEYVTDADAMYSLRDDMDVTNSMLSLGFTKTLTGWTRLRTKREVLHAESNAISKIARSTQSSEGATLYVTLAPCYECSKLIIQSGIKRVVYQDEYRDASSITLLKKANIEVVKYERAFPVCREVSSSDDSRVYPTRKP